MIRPRAWIAALLIGLMLAASGCGRRPQTLDPPEGEENRFPREYPSS